MWSILFPENIPWYVGPVCAFQLIMIPYKLFGMVSQELMTTTRRLLAYTNYAYFLATIYWILYYANYHPNAREIIFQLALILGIIITVMFWGLYMISPSFIYDQPATNKQMPKWYKILAHGGIQIFLVIDLKFTQHTLCYSFSDECMYIGVMALCMYFTQYMYKYIYGRFIYGFFAKMNFLLIVLFFVAAWGIACLMDLGYRVILVNYIS